MDTESTGVPMTTTLASEPKTNLLPYIREAINKASAENGSNTPDLILAEYLTICLMAFEKATEQREAWYGGKMYPGWNSGRLETVTPPVDNAHVADGCEQFSAPNSGI